MKMEEKIIRVARLQRELDQCLRELEEELDKTQEVGAWLGTEVKREYINIHAYKLDLASLAERLGSRVVVSSRESEFLPYEISVSSGSVKLFTVEESVPEIEHDCMRYDVEVK